MLEIFLVFVFISNLAFVIFVSFRRKSNSVQTSYNELAMKCARIRSLKASRDECTDGLKTIEIDDLRELEIISLLEAVEKSVSEEIAKKIELNLAQDVIELASFRRPK